MTRFPRRFLPLLSALTVSACDRAPEPQQPAAELPDEPSPVFRNVAEKTAYVGDAACTSCHAATASVYEQHPMARSFHRWTRQRMIEPPPDSALVHRPSGYAYTIVDSGGALYQREMIVAPDGRRIHELTRRMDWVMGSGVVARTYFTEENGRFFQLPLTWYRDHGWDFSPGYELNNARFDRLLPDRCVACHASYPDPYPYVEGKYEVLRPGIGCERCHGPGELHAETRRAAASRTTAASAQSADTGLDNTIVNPARLPLARRLDVCEQCHVHTAVTVLREGEDAFSYLPSEPLRDQIAFFKVAGSIDIVSHADRLRQSACLLGTVRTSQPLECATCHNPHQPPPDRAAQIETCTSCHALPQLQQTLAGSDARGAHTASGDCIACHMPRVKDRGVPHGTFTDHWIRVVDPDEDRPRPRRVPDGSPIEAYFARDRSGPEADIYRSMGEIVYATLASDIAALRQGATTLDRALGADTTRGEAHFLLGVAWQQLGRDDAAAASLERALAIDPDRPDRLHALAQTYERLGRPAATIDSLYRRALALTPMLAWLRIAHADFLQAQGRSDAARQAYRQALGEQPNHATGWFNLGTLLAGEGDLTGASQAFRQAATLDPSLGQAMASLFAVATRDTTIVGVERMGRPLPSLLVRERSPRAAQLAPVTVPDVPGLRIFNIPRGGSVQIFRPNGALVAALPTGDSYSVTWNLLTAAGRPAGAGLYTAQIRGADVSGRPAPPQQISFGIVRRRSE